jgi:hypothetical protein
MGMASERSARLMDCVMSVLFMSKWFCGCKVLALASGRAERRFYSDNPAFFAEKCCLLFRSFLGVSLRSTACLWSCQAFGLCAIKFMLLLQRLAHPLGFCI